MRVETPRALREIRVAGGVHGLVPQLGVRELARDLRRRRLVPSRELDVPATLAATLRTGGLVTQVFASRIEPDYLFLIDRASLRDHQAALADAVAETLETSNVSVQRWYFDREPTRCRRVSLTTAGATTEVFSLDELAARHPGHRVLMFTKAEAFPNEYTGAPKGWLEILRRWPEWVVFTLEPPERWGRREAALGRLGITLLPLTRARLVVFAEIFGGHSAERNFGGPAQGSPRSFARMPLRWLDREPPAPENVTQLCDELAQHLGPLGFQWLAACAVYPEVHWGMTLRFGAVVMPGERQMETLLPRLSRLLWLRKAFLPDWLRAALLHRLALGAATRVRAALQGMLGQASLAGAAGIALHIAVKKPRARGALARLWQRGVSWLLDWNPARLFRRSIAVAAPEIPMRDYVFLRFMSGQKIPPLGVAAPSLLARLLFPQGVRLISFRPVVLVLCGLPIATAALGWMGLSRSAIYDAQFSPDGTRIVTACWDNTARLWDAATGKAQGVPMRHVASVASAAFSPDGARIVTASWDHTARLWETATGKAVNEPLPHHDMVTSAAFSPDGTRVVTCGWDQTAQF